MMTEQKALVRSDVRYKVRVEHEVTAKVEAMVTFLRSEVAEWLECDEVDVTPEDVQSYAREYETDDGETLIGEEEFTLKSIETWDSAEVEMLWEERLSIVPPSFVPLFDLEDTANPS